MNALCEKEYTGLTTAQAQQRMAQGLSNKTSAGAGRSVWQIILANTLTYFNLIFVIMAALMLFVGSSILNLTFMVVVVINTVIGCFQEIRAKKAVDKLTLVAAQTVKVFRDGKETMLRSDLLVADDLVAFTPGDQICADGILCGGQLFVNESLITGEPDAIEKTKGASLRSGSFVISGHGTVRLTQVGDESYAAKLAAEAKADPRAAKSEMMRSLDWLIRLIGFLLIPVGLCLFWGQLQQPHATVRTGVEGTVAALVGMIPEGLYLLTSVALAVSALKLTRRRVLVQDMNCIESLARVDILCVDKTGTITEPAMEVEQVIPLKAAPLPQLEQILGAVYGAREPDNDTAQAIAARFPTPVDWHCQQYIPFDSRTKWVAAVFPSHGTYVIGAPELILGANYHTIRDAVETHIVTGCRVLLIAAYDGMPSQEGLSSVLVKPLGLVLLSNRIRPQARETFEYFARQGVTIKVISGDNPLTVSQVALRAGIAHADKYIDTQTLHTDQELAQAAEAYTVFGRVTPEKKKALIRAMQAQGHIVAMTGDGVNDVLAMKESDCGVAMATGAQAASQVARLVLLDSDFAAMPHIVDEGRRVINNIQRAAALFLVKNIFSLGLALVTLFAGLRFPLESFHLSIVSSLTIGVPGFFLAMEPNYERVTGSFLGSTLRKALPGGLTGMLVVLLAQFFIYQRQIPIGDAQTISTAILLAGGLLVLYRVCSPFSLLRRLVWGAMAIGVIGAFFVLPPVVGYLKISNPDSWLVLAGMVGAVPLVFAALSALCRMGDKLFLKTK